MQENNSQEEHFYPVFSTLPDEDYIERWKEHITTTGYPETFEFVTRTKPDTTATLRLLSGEIKVPMVRREGQERVPCPICHPTSPWFEVGRMAWFPDDECVRFIGHDCARKHFAERFQEAESRFQKERRLVYLKNRWAALAAKQTPILAYLETLADAALELERFRAMIDKEAQSRGFSRFFYNELTRNSGQIQIIVDTGLKDRKGERVVATDVLGHVVGAELWDIPFVPHQQFLGLQKTAADLSRPLPEWRMGNHDERVEDEILSRAREADMLPERIEDLHDLIVEAGLFFRPENLALLERWGKNNSSPFQSLVCNFHGQEFVIRSLTYAGWHFNKQKVSLGVIRSVKHEIPSEILELRRLNAKDR